MSSRMFFLLLFFFTFWNQNKLTSCISVNKTSMKFSQGTKEDLFNLLLRSLFLFPRQKHNFSSRHFHTYFCCGLHSWPATASLTNPYECLPWQGLDSTINPQSRALCHLLDFFLIKHLWSQAILINWHVTKSVMHIKKKGPEWIVSSSKHCPENQLTLSSNGYAIERGERDKKGGSP